MSACAVYCTSSCVKIGIHILSELSQIKQWLCTQTNLIIRANSLLVTLRKSKRMTIVDSRKKTEMSASAGLDFVIKICTKFPLQY